LGRKALIVVDLLFNIPASESWIGTILGRPQTENIQELLVYSNFSPLRKERVAVMVETKSTKLSRNRHSESDYRGSWISNIKQIC
jgi:hypothetical protein